MKVRPEYNPKIIGQNLKRLREQHGYSVEDIRKYLYLGSVQAIYKYESGKGYPPVDTMFALMELYHVEMWDIVSPEALESRVRKLWDIAMCWDERHIHIERVLFLRGNSSQYVRLSPYASLLAG
ncbi:MAG: helix-turn-helix transcriptional regulator [Lachnospiraceae bacterium]|nr:helix-turn-helix transcriptional regulator [Lachnospiraceae bacterium]